MDIKEEKVIFGANNAYRSNIKNYREQIKYYINVTLVELQ